MEIKKVSKKDIKQFFDEFPEGECAFNELVRRMCMPIDKDKNVDKQAGKKTSKI